MALGRAAEEAGTRLDELLSQGDRPTMRPFVLSEGLRDRELRTEADVDAVLDALRERLLAQIQAGIRVRLT